ncbi:unnamed protein product [Sphacelaria rigidula]
MVVSRGERRLCYSAQRQSAAGMFSGTSRCGRGGGAGTTQETVVVAAPDSCHGRGGGSGSGDRGNWSSSAIGRGRSGGEAPTIRDTLWGTAKKTTELNKREGKHWGCDWNQVYLSVPT